MKRTEIKEVLATANFGDQVNVKRMGKSLSSKSLYID